MIWKCFRLLIRSDLNFYMSSSDDTFQWTKGRPRRGRPSIKERMLALFFSVFKNFIEQKHGQIDDQDHCKNANHSIEHDFKRFEK